MSGSSLQQSGGRPPIAPLDEFIRRFTEQRGEIHFAKDRAEIIALVNSLVKSKGNGLSCVVPSLVVEFHGSVEEISSSIQTTAKFSEFQENPIKIARDLDIGITKAPFAVAETGTIVDISYSDEERLLSSISRVHISILNSPAVLPKLQDLVPKIRELLSHPEKTKPSITFIGGPSRTSDIELKSVIGVHGPHEVHVVVYGT